MCVPLLLIVATSIISRMVPAFRAMQKRIDTANRILREQITGIRVVRAFVREPQTAQFRTANRDLTSVVVRAGRWMATFPRVMLILNVSIVGVLWFGGHRGGCRDAPDRGVDRVHDYLMQILMS